MITMYLITAAATTGLALLWPAPQRALNRITYSHTLSAPRKPKLRWSPLRSRRRGDITLELAAALTEVAAVLRTGVTTAAAWQVIAEAHPAGDTNGADTIHALASHAALGYALHESPVCHKLGTAGAALMAAEAVSARTGAPIGTLLTTIADSLRAEVDAAAIRKAAYAGPKATVKVLAALPFVSLALGYGMGADPIAAFTDTWLGHLTLVIGLALAAAGWLVPHRMVERAEQRGSVQ